MVLDLRKADAFTDYFVICSGQNVRQIKAIADAVEESLRHDQREAGARRRLRRTRNGCCSITSTSSFTFSARRPATFYALERLWGSATAVAVRSVDRSARTERLKYEHVGTGGAGLRCPRAFSVALATSDVAPGLSPGGLPSSGLTGTASLIRRRARSTVCSPSFSRRAARCAPHRGAAHSRRGLRRPAGSRPVHHPAQLRVLRRPVPRIAHCARCRPPPRWALSARSRARSARHAPGVRIPARRGRARALGAYATRCATRPRAEVRRQAVDRAAARHPRCANTAAAVLAGMDAVVPVPLHRRRRAERGFNQADDLAVSWVCRCGASCARTRDTAPQSTLAAPGHAERARRVCSAPQPVQRPATAPRCRRLSRAGRRRDHDGRDARSVRARCLKRAARRRCARLRLHASCRSTPRERTPETARGLMSPRAAR